MSLQTRRAVRVVAVVSAAATVICLVLLGPRSTSSAPPHKYLKPAVEKTIHKPAPPVIKQFCGHVVYGRTPHSGADEPSDIFEVDLSTGKSKLLISHSSFPKGDELRLSEIQASVDGQYLLVCMDRHNAYTYWIWSRATGQVRSVPGVRDLSCVRWAPRTQTLAFAELAVEGRPVDTAITFCDARTLHTWRSPKFSDVTAWAWNATGTAVLVARAAGRGGVVYSVPPKRGKPVLLFRWPRRVCSLAQSPAGFGSIFADEYGVHIAGRRIRRIGGISIPTRVRGADMAYAFDRSSGVAWAFMSTWYGEPGVGHSETLYRIDCARAAARELYSEDGSYLGVMDGGCESQFDDFMRPRNGPFVALSASYSQGDPDLSEVRNDRHGLFVLDTSKRKPEPRQVFDSDLGCAAIDWWQ